MKKKIIISIPVSLILILLFVLFLRRTVSYEISYDLEGFDIKESYDKKSRIYSFSMMYEDKVYEFFIKNDFLHQKELIDGFDILEEDNEKCLILKSGKLDTYPQCYKEDNLIDYDLLEHKNDEFYKRDHEVGETSKYKNIEIYGLNDFSLAIWNSKGYYYLTEKKEESISFLSEESYYNNLATTVDNFILTPNYDEDYNFKTVHVLDLKTGKSTKWELGFEISLNFYYMGNIDGKVYLLDRKNRAEYSLDPKKKRIVLVSENDEGVVWNNEWEKLSMTKLIGEEYKFAKKDFFNYHLREDKLCLSIGESKKVMKVIDQKISKIISIKDDVVFYLVDDKLYSYSLLEGERLLAKYSEWKFNNLNSLFIY